jgi:hypothetical protein
MWEGRPWVSRPAGRPATAPAATPALRAANPSPPQNTRAVRGPLDASAHSTGRRRAPAQPAKARGGRGPGAGGRGFGEKMGPPLALCVCVRECAGGVLAVQRSLASAPGVAASPRSALGRAGTAAGRTSRGRSATRRCGRPPPRDGHGAPSFPAAGAARRRPPWHWRAMGSWPWRAALRLTRPVQRRANHTLLGRRTAVREPPGTSARVPDTRLALAPSLPRASPVCGVGPGLDRGGALRLRHPPDQNGARAHRRPGGPRAGPAGRGWGLVFAPVPRPRADEAGCELSRGAAAPPRGPRPTGPAPPRPRPRSAGLVAGAEGRQGGARGAG